MSYAPFRDTPVYDMPQRCDVCEITVAAEGFDYNFASEGEPSDWRQVYACEECAELYYTCNCATCYSTCHHWVSDCAECKRWDK